MLKDIIVDFRRFSAELSGKWHLALISQGFWAIAFYRVERSVRCTSIPMLRIFSPVFVPLRRLVEIVTQISLPGTAAVGRGLYIPHYGPIIVSGRAVIGAFCTISHGVTIGRAGRGLNTPCPVIGDMVFIGAGALVLGGISVGERAVIGAGAVVIRDVEPRSVVVGNPARVVSHRGSDGLLEYPRGDVS